MIIMLLETSFLGKQQFIPCSVKKQPPVNSNLKAKSWIFMTLQITTKIHLNWRVALIKMWCYLFDIQLKLDQFILWIQVSVMDFWLQGKRWAKLQRFSDSSLHWHCKGSGQELLIRRRELQRQNLRQQSTRNFLPPDWRSRGNSAVRVWQRGDPSFPVLLSNLPLHRPAALTDMVNFNPHHSFGSVFCLLEFLSVFVNLNIHSSFYLFSD